MIYLLLVFAFLIRLISLNQSLWLDEATTARVVQQYSFLDVATKFSPHDFHPPLYYLSMKFWTNLFGYSEIALRFPSIIFSLLTGWIVYLIGKKIKNEKFSFWAVAFFLFNPLIIYYSQEARMYMMATFFLTVALYYYLGLSPEILSRLNSSLPLLKQKVSKNFGSSPILFFNIFISLAFLTFYGSIFLIIPMFLYLLYKKQYRFFFVSFLMLSSSLLVLLPLVYRQFVNAQQQLLLVPNWTQVLGTTNLKNLFLIPLKFAFGRISFQPKLLYWAVAGIWTAFVWFFVLKGGLKQRSILFFIIGSMGFGILFSFFTPLLQYFRFIYLIPLISVLISFAQKNTIYRLIIFFGFISFSLLYLLFPGFHREDWKSLANSLPSDKKIYMIYSSSDPIQYYRSDLNLGDLRALDLTKLKYREIIIIPYTSEIYGLDYAKILRQSNYNKKKTRNFRGIYYEVWERGENIFLNSLMLATI
ncbi:glycosyltransferase family 39 protein [Candidatus Roizmanbacteria bacterium]|nr:glycosyltransferase family 39 protein [Candidatus Roizmanbacteria bacterium]